MTQVEFDDLTARCLAGDTAALEVYPQAAEDFLSEAFFHLKQEQPSTSYEEIMMQQDEYLKTWNMVIGKIDQILTAHATHAADTTHDEESAP